MGSERPILFSGPMVRAIPEEQKTQTRRVIKTATGESLPEYARYLGAGSAAVPRWAPVGGTTADTHLWDVTRTLNLLTEARCPYGIPGDRLWVRETWALEDCGEDGKRVIWQADRAAAWVMPNNVLGEIYYLPSDYDPGRWRPSIHMPRWASRITLEVTEVRVQRLQEISEEDAEAEGVEAAPFCKAGRPNGMEHVEAFEGLWQRINGRRPGCSWEANPFVWCISFRRLP